MTVLRPGRRMSSVLAVSALVGTALATHAPAAGAATGDSTARAVTTYVRTAADQRIATALSSRVTTTRFGSSFSGAVMDSGSNILLWSKGGDTALMPASTTKLVTAHNVLTTFGPGHRLTTMVRQGSAANRVVLVGSGDPTLTSTALDALAGSTASALKANGVTSVRVYADDYLFPAPSLATGWKSSYVPTDITPVRALVRSQRHVDDTTVDAAVYFRDRLKAHGVSAGYWGRAKASTSARVLASQAGYRMDTIVNQMLLNSDNEHAEALHKLVGIRLGTGAAWSGAATAQRARMVSRGLTTKALYDGSGLSRSDRLTGVQLARLVDAAFDARNSTSLAPLRSTAAMPTSGKTGTLQSAYGRFVTADAKCAVGKVFAKTGSLSDAVSLAGWTVAKDGRVKTFAFVVNGRSSTLTLKQSIDMLAATVNGCY
jgi:D-alanyl-D-alanine carboxypeptidase/D-alanyl-D-alanine-endopeptidase (penicillin-binding protein 4)